MIATTAMIKLDTLARSARHLKALPASVSRLSALIAAEIPKTEDIVRVVELDSALTLRVLRAANSAGSGSVGTIVTIREAVLRLGFGTLMALATSSGVEKQLARPLPAYGLSDGELWRHSVATALAAESAQEFCQTPFPPETFTAALLHDVGKLVMAQFLDEDILKLLAAARESGGLSSRNAESELLLVHHGELGGLVAQHWKLPERIVTGIIYHHTPGMANDIIADAVHVANIAAKRAGTGYAATDADLQVDPESMERLGITDERFALLSERVRERLEPVLAMYGG